MIAYLCLYAGREQGIDDFFSFSVVQARTLLIARYASQVKGGNHDVKWNVGTVVQHPFLQKVFPVGHDFVLLVVWTFFQKSGTCEGGLMHDGVFQEEADCHLLRGLSQG